MLSIFLCILSLGLDTARFTERSRHEIEFFYKLFVVVLYKALWIQVGFFVCVFTVTIIAWDSLAPVLLLPRVKWLRFLCVSAVTLSVYIVFSPPRMCIS